MQIVEISTSLEKDLGILWNNATASSSSGGSSSGSSSGSSTPGLINENETLPSTNGNGKIGDFFKIGNFSRSPLQALSIPSFRKARPPYFQTPFSCVERQASQFPGGRRNTYPHNDHQYYRQHINPKHNLHTVRG